MMSITPSVVVAPSPALAPAFEIEGYRSFRDRARIEIRPMTLIFGRNQAGKSTLLRFMLLLADSLFGDKPILDLESAGQLGATFKEIGWLGPQPSNSPIFKLESLSTKNFVEIQLTDSDGVVPNTVRIGTGAKDAFDASWAGASSRSAAGYNARFAGKSGKTTWEGMLTFPRMLPVGLPAPANRRVVEILESFRSLERLQWIAATKGSTERQPIGRCCRSDGSDLATILLDKKEVVAAASEWLSMSSTLAETISIGRDGTGVPRIELRRSANEALPQELAGEGARWLLPILLSAAWAESKSSDAPTMLAIEEPEARLHPNIQLALFDRLLQTVALNIPCVLETHSIYLLRRMQLAVAKGELDPALVAIYWVEKDGEGARVRPVNVESDGTLIGWNPETFEEEQMLSRQLFEARWSQGRQ